MIRYVGAGQERSNRYFNCCSSQYRISIFVSKSTLFILFLILSNATSCSALNKKCVIYDGNCNMSITWLLFHPSYKSISCPTGYVEVPYDLAVGTTRNFCVAKFEMKNDNGAKSQAAGNPWVSIDQNTAKSQCSSLSTGYHLITNPEWMTIARNIETVDSNWSGGTTESGNLSRGWSNTGNVNVASITDSTCLYNAGADICASSGTHLFNRTHTLSNNEIIWDFAGNVWEWNDWNVINDRSNSGTAAYIEINTVAVPTTTMTAETFQSSNKTLTASTNAIGMYYPASNGSGGATLRGGYWFSEVIAGAFALDMNNEPSTTASWIGFRCAYSE